MKNRTRILGWLLLLVLASTPAYAAVREAKVETKPLSFIEFSGLQQNWGLHGRSLERKYDEYRKGRIAVSTLDISKMR